MDHKSVGHALNSPASGYGPGQALMNTVTNFWFPQKTWNLITSWVAVSFSRRTLLHGVS